MFTNLIYKNGLIYINIYAKIEQFNVIYNILQSHLR